LWREYYYFQLPKKTKCSNSKRILSTIQRSLWREYYYFQLPKKTKCSNSKRILSTIQDHCWGNTTFKTNCKEGENFRMLQLQKNKNKNEDKVKRNTWLVMVGGKLLMINT
jgi:hypothetical protein